MINRYEAEELIRRINILRKEQKISARSLSQSINMNDGYINRLECKKDFSPSFDVLIELLKVLNCPLEKFFYDSMEEYETDKAILNLLSKVSKERKELILQLLELDKDCK